MTAINNAAELLAAVEAARFGYATPSQFRANSGNDSECAKFAASHLANMYADIGLGYRGPIQHGGEIVGLVLDTHEVTPITGPVSVWISFPTTWAAVAAELEETRDECNAAANSDCW